jgi:hypothetical protein
LSYQAVACFIRRCNIEHISACHHTLAVFTPYHFLWRNLGWTSRHPFQAKEVYLIFLRIVVTIKVNKL